jgi:hypothetical protein
VGPVILAVKRSRAHAGILAAIGTVTLVLVALLVGLSAFLHDASTGSVRSTLEAAPPTASALLVEADLSEDPEGQSAAATVQFNALLARTPMLVFRTVQTTGVAVERPTAPLDPTLPDVLLRADPLLTEKAELVDGEWAQEDVLPTGQAPATLQADAAARLGITVGDSLTLGGSSVPVVVVATWRPLDIGDPYWFADPAVVTGLHEDAAGPMIVAESVLTSLPVQSSARWLLTPDLSAATRPSMKRLASAVSRVQTRIVENQVPAVGAATMKGALASTLDAISARLGAVTAIAAVPLALVAALGLVALWQLVYLLGAARSPDNRLLRSRGVSAGQLAQMSAVESFAIALPAAVLGMVGAALALSLTVNAGAVTASIISMWPIALTASLVVVAASLVAEWGGGRRAQGLGGDRRSLAGIVGATVIALGAAGLSLWQLRLYGSTPASVAGGEIDAAAVLAPTVVLVALGLVALLLYALVVRALAPLTSRLPGIAPVLPVRQVARRMPLYGLVVLLVTLSVGGTWFAAGFERGWSMVDARVALLRTGSDVRVSVDVPHSIGEGDPSLSAWPYAAIKGAQTAVPVLATEAAIGGETVPFVAMRAASFGSNAAFPDGATAASVADALEEEAPGVELPNRTVSVHLQVSTPSDSAHGTIAVFVWLSDEDGELTRLPVGSTGVEAAHTSVTLSATVPPGTWRVLAAEASLAQSQGATNVEVNLSGPSMPDPLDMTLSWKDPTRRAMVTKDGHPAALGVVVTDTTADNMGASVGDRLLVRLTRSGATMEAVIVGTAAVLPGTTGSLGIAADLPSLNAHLLRSSERIPQFGDVWIRSTQPDGVAAAAAAVSHRTSVVTSRATQSSALLLAPALIVLWWAMAGSLVLAAVGFGAMTASLREARQGEIRALRALGLSGRSQGRARFAEAVTVVIAGFILGAGAGHIVTASTVDVLVRAAVGETVSSIPVPLDFTVPVLSILLGAFLAVTAGIAAISALQVSREAAPHRKLAKR